jgi:hypothetical protein
LKDTLTELIIGEQSLGKVPQNIATTPEPLVVPVKNDILPPAVGVGYAPHAERVGPVGVI